MMMKLKEEHLSWLVERIPDWLQTWTQDGVFEQIMRDAGQCVEERYGFKLYECFVDGTFAKAKGGGDGIGATKAGKGVKLMVWVDARCLPVSVDTTSASPPKANWYNACSAS
jgi:hypothetical protein